jgi:selenocysteine lyase/cysteine desulfurase
MSPMLNEAASVGIRAIEKRIHPWNIVPRDWFSYAEELRPLFAQIIHAKTDNIALIPSVSYGMAIAAKNIAVRAGQTIVLLDQEFPSNVYVWQELAQQTGAHIVNVRPTEQQSWTEAAVHAITDATAIVAVPNCHWTNGAVIDLEAIGRKARSVNAKLVIDASQSVGAYPLNVQVVKPDFLVAVGYKWLFGLYSLSYLYADEKYFDNGQPLEHSWINKEGSEDFAALVNYREQYRPGAYRFSAGEFPGFIHAPMAIAALKQVLAWGVANIQETLSTLTNEIEVRARAKGYTPVAASQRVGHIIGIQMDAGKTAALSKQLAANNVYVSVRGNSIRVAPHVYNDLQDVDKLVSLL